MSELRPCPECDRHVRNDETSCPFCSAAIGEATARKLPIGRLTRAAVFAGALVGASACGPAQTPAANPDDQPPPPTEVADAGNPSPEEPVDAQAAQPPTPPDAAQARQRPRPDHNIPMPYGAPPARQRLV